MTVYIPGSMTLEIDSLLSAGKPKNCSDRLYVQAADNPQLHAQVWLVLEPPGHQAPHPFLLTFETVAMGYSLFPGGFLFQNHYPSFRGAPFCPFRRPLTRRRSVDWGLGSRRPRHVLHRPAKPQSGLNPRFAGCTRRATVEKPAPLRSSYRRSSNFAI